jgi:predicted XRE-type DNA-binding protein
MSGQFFVEKSSGNVFADLGLPNADELYAKAVLSVAIERTIRQREMSSVDAARFLGLARAEFDDVVRGGFSRYSIDELIAFLNALGWRGERM